MLISSQISAAQKAQLENWFSLTQKAFAGVEKMVELNLQTTRNLMNEVADHTHALLSAKDAQEFLSLQTGAMQPAAEKAVSYNRHVYDIASSTNAEISKVAEAQIAQAQKRVLSMIDNAMKNAPAGTENAAALVKSAVAAANNAFESVHKAAKQAANVAEANFQAVTSSAIKAAQSSKKRATA